MTQPTAREYLEEAQSWLWPKGWDNDIPVEDRWVTESWVVTDFPGATGPDLQPGGTVVTSACTMGAMIIARDLLTTTKRNYNDINSSVIEMAMLADPAFAHAVDLIAAAIKDEDPGWQVFSSKPIQLVAEFNDAEGTSPHDVLRILQRATKRAIEEEA